MIPDVQLVQKVPENREERIFLRNLASLYNFHIIFADVYIWNDMEVNGVPQPRMFELEKRKVRQRRLLTSAVS